MVGEGNHYNQKYGRDNSKNHCSTDNDQANPFRLFFAKIAGYEDCDSHSKLCYHKSHKVQYLTAGRNSRQSGCRAEASNYQKVYCTICCLQYKGTKNRQHKKGKLFQNASLCKIIFFICQGQFSFHT